MLLILFLIGILAAMGFAGFVFFWAFAKAPRTCKECWEKKPGGEFTKLINICDACVEKKRQANLNAP